MTFEEFMRGPDITIGLRLMREKLPNGEDFERWTRTALNTAFQNGKLEGIRESCERTDELLACAGLTADGGLT